jgi:hypothetical protein
MGSFFFSLFRRPLKFGILSESLSGRYRERRKKGLFYLSTCGRLSSKDLIIGSTLEAIGPEGDH